MVWEKLSKDNAAFIVVDIQAGLATGVRDQSQPEFMTSVEAIVNIAKLFNLPTILTSSKPEGPNGPILQIVTDTLPDAQIFHRKGEIDAFDNPEFVSAVEALGRKKLIMIGITTDVCLTFASIHGLTLGYEVYAVIDASGAPNKYMTDLAITRMSNKGVEIMTWFAVACELMGDWRNDGSDEFATILGEGLPWYGDLFQSYNSWTSGSTGGEGGEGGSVTNQTKGLNETATKTEEGEGFNASSSIEGGASFNITGGGDGRRFLFGGYL